MTDYPKTYQLPKGIIVHERRHLAANGFFFAGGIYFENEKGVRQYKYGQMYVEVYVPRKITQPYPLIFYHGGGQSGLCWMETADKREGWADFFLKEGYVVYVVDVPARGRSAYHVDIDGPLSRLTSELCYQYFAGNTGNWETAKLHTQWPETMEKDPRGYDQNYDQLCSAMVDQIGVVRQQEAVRDASIKLLERTGQAIIVTHSLSGPYGWVIADAKPDKVKAVVSLEPSGPPFAGISITAGKQRPYGIADIPLGYDPSLNPPQWRKEETVIPPPIHDVNAWLQSEPVGKLVNLKDIPVALLTAEASYHSPFDHITAAFLKQAGVKVDHIKLQEHGFHGNGHMFVMEKNSDEVAGFIHQWLLEHLKEET